VMGIQCRRPLFRSRLVPEGEFLEVARQKVEELEVIRTSDPPLPLTWVDLAPTGQQAFAYQNHCFDVAGEADYAEVVASIIALAGEDCQAMARQSLRQASPGRDDMAHPIAWRSRFISWGAAHPST
jgi:hypothetical protein